MFVQIEMAHKVLGSDMTKLVNSVKLAQQYRATVLDEDYRKGILKAAHTLAIDARALLQAVDNGRLALTHLRLHLHSSVASASPAAAAAANVGDGKVSSSIAATGNSDVPRLKQDDVCQNSETASATTS